MTNVEIALLLVLTAYGIVFSTVCAALFSRTRRNQSSIEITNNILDHHTSRIDRIDFLVQKINYRLGEINKEVSEMEINIKKCEFIATLDDSSTHKIVIKVPQESPSDYVWMLAIRQCENFNASLRQLRLNEVTIEKEVMVNDIQ